MQSEIASAWKPGARDRGVRIHLNPIRPTVQEWFAQAMQGSRSSEPGVLKGFENGSHKCEPCSHQARRERMKNFEAESVLHLHRQTPRIKNNSGVTGPIRLVTPGDTDIWRVIESRAPSLIE